MNTSFQVGGVTYNADQNGIVTESYTPGFFTTGDNKWYYADARGRLVTGAQTINGQNLYFREDGQQVKGDFGLNADGSRSYYHGETGDKLVSTFFTTGNNVWYYADASGKVVTGPQVINGQNLYFREDGQQVKGGFATNANGSRSYYHGDSGERLVSTFFTTGNNDWYYADANGQVVTGEQVINGQRLYFDQTGKQVKGQKVTNTDGTISYFDPNTGDKMVNRWVSLPNGRRVYFNAQGKAYAAF